MSQGSSQTYKESYEKLKRCADTLREAKEPDIDSLVPLVTEASGAFNICKERIKAVREALSESLPSQEAPEAS